jgi:hypothetical protein
LGAQDKIVCFEGDTGLALSSPTLRRHPAAYRSDNGRTQLILKGKRVMQFVSMSLRPHVLTADGLNQLSSNPNAIPHAANATFDTAGNAQFGGESFALKPREQTVAQRHLKTLHLKTDGGGGDIQLLTCPNEAGVLARRFESAQRVEWMMVFAHESEAK